MSDIRFRLGLNSQDFDRGLGAVEKSATGFSKRMDKAGQQVSESFSAGNVFKGLLQGAGIGSVQKMAELLSEGFKAAAESAKTIAESTAKTLGLYERIFASRRTDEQNLDANRRAQERLLRELGGIKDPAGRTRTVMGAGFQTRTITEGPSEAAAQEVAEKRAKIGEQLAELALEEQDLKKKIAETEKKAATDAKKATEDRAKALKELDELQRDNARAAMSEEEQIADLKEEQSALITAAANGEGDWIANLKEAAKLQREIRTIEERRAEAQKKRIEEEKRLNKELERARRKEKEALSDLRNARTEQFTFTLGDAAQGKRGSPSARTKAKLMEGKTAQMERIADQGGYQVTMDANGQPTLSSADPSRADAARQATGRFRTLYNDREALRGSIGNLAKSDRDPFAENIKGVKTAVEYSSEVLEQIRDAKFTNQ